MTGGEDFCRKNIEFGSNHVSLDSSEDVNLAAGCMSRNVSLGFIHT